MKGIMKMICIFKIYYVLVLNCPEKDVSCLPSCGADGSSLGNVTSQLQCASKSARFFIFFIREASNKKNPVSFD